ncbi:hypothetical protein Ga0466249_004748 [Sporomusaceae bacterium BoRhaA]|uniref:hypothetical protein n=1 Tax=Pelorhabdus rhamnosifermentans TaxID=2772457 RepID=UPI001C0604C9|nr:hypothetical protein [Pelorhabdus rhamnosifermentans]MBU2703603.1 hypothetical protein [Pelorhabdus rhamnosifermentans]
MLNADISNHLFRLLHDQDYRSGYAYAIDRDFIFDLFSPAELIQLSVIYHALQKSHADGIAYYCWELACRKEGVSFESCPSYRKTGQKVTPPTLARNRASRLN